MVIDSSVRKWLSERFGDRVRYDEPMARHTYIGVGGPAEAFVTPESLAELRAIVRYCYDGRLPYMIIGGGTNLLVRDGGIRGIVISLKACLTGMFRTGETGDGLLMTVLSGTTLASFCRRAVDQGQGGMSFALGIPGTVGGAIRMNAGTHLGKIESVIDSVSLLLPTGETVVINRKSLVFGYRSLSLGGDLEGEGKQPVTILSGCFRLRSGDPVVLRREAEAVLSDRRDKQPLDQPSAGCFFKNPASGKPAGELIDLAGLKGKHVGGAEISIKHGNFFVNTGDASSGDFLALMKMVQDAVSTRFGIDLEPEVAIVGT